MEYIPSQLVAEEKPAPPKGKLFHPLLTNQRYSQIGRNAVLHASPSVLCFHGLQVGETQQSTLKLFNVSSSSIRMHILLDCGEETAFSMSVEKKGMIAAGMCESVRVKFIPEEYRYHYGEIKIHTNDGNIVVPIHAYPIMNTLTDIFPSKIDMPIAEIGFPVYKTVDLVCTVPINFDFDFVILNSDPSFNVYPLKGIVPANGKITITIEFKPLKKITSHMKLLVNISQYNFKPFICTITATTKFQENEAIVAKKISQTLQYNNQNNKKRPGSRNGRQSSTINNNSIIMTPRIEDDDNTTNDDDSAPVTVRRNNFMNSQASSSSSSSNNNNNRTKRDNLYSKAKLNVTSSSLSDDINNIQQHDHSSPSRNKVIGKKGPVYIVRADNEEVRLPLKVMSMPAEQLNSHYLTNFVLTQEPGKMKIQELKEVIKQRKEAAINATRTHKNISSSSLLSNEPITATSSIKGHIVSQVHDQNYFIKPNMNVDFPGETAQVKKMVFNTQFNNEQHNERFLKVNPTKIRMGQEIMTTNDRNNLEDIRFNTYITKRSIIRDKERNTHQPKLSGEHVIQIYEQTPNVIPNYDVFDNDIWDMRKKSLDKFMKSIAKTVIQTRVNTRISRIKDILRKGKQNNQKIGKSALRIAAKQGEEGVHTKFKKLLNINNILTLSFPSYQDEIHNNTIIDEINLPIFNHLYEEEYEIPWEYKLLNFKPYNVPNVPSYMPIETSRLLRSGNGESNYKLDIRGQNNIITDNNNINQNNNDHIIGKQQKQLLSTTNTTSNNNMDQNNKTTTSIITIPKRFMASPSYTEYSTLRSRPSTTIRIPLLPCSEGTHEYKFHRKFVTPTKFGDEKHQPEFKSLSTLRRLVSVSQVWRSHSNSKIKSNLKKEFHINLSTPKYLDENTYVHDDSYEDKDQYETKDVAFKRDIMNPSFEDAKNLFKIKTNNNNNINDNQTTTTTTTQKSLRKKRSDRNGKTENNTSDILIRMTKPILNKYDSVDVIDQMLEDHITISLYALSEEAQSINRLTLNPNLCVQPSLEENE